MEILKHNCHVVIILRRVKLIFTFTSIIGAEEGIWHMDLKNAPGSSGSGEPTAATDVTFSLSDADFHKLFEGKKHFVFSYLTSLHFWH